MAADGAIAGDAVGIGSAVAVAGAMAGEEATEDGASAGCACVANGVAIAKILCVSPRQVLSLVGSNMDFRPRENIVTVHQSSPSRVRRSVLAARR